MLSHNIINNEINVNTTILNEVYTISNVLPRENIIETTNFLIVKSNDTTILSIDKRCGLICFFIKSCEVLKALYLKIERYLKENKLDYKIYNIQ